MPSNRKPPQFGDHVNSATTTPEQRHKAALSLVSLVEDKQEAKMFLQMLGLDDE